MFKIMIYAIGFLLTLIVGGVIGLVVLGLNFSMTNFFLYGASYVITFVFNRGLNYVLQNYIKKD